MSLRAQLAALAALAAAFVRTRLTALPLVLVLGAVVIGHALGASFSGLDARDRLRGDAEQRLMVLEIGVLALGIAQAAFARSRDAHSRHLALVLSTPVARPVLAFGQWLGAVAFSVLLLVAGGVLVLAPLAAPGREASLLAVAPQRVVRPVSTSLEGEGTYVLAGEASVRVRFIAEAARALRFRVRTLEPRQAQLRFEVRAGDRSAVLERRGFPGGRLTVELPAELDGASGPIEVTLRAVDQSPPVLISAGDLELLAGRIALPRVTLAMLAGFAGLACIPVGLAVALGCWLRGGLAFLLALLVALAGSFAPFFRDAVRYLDPKDPRSVALPSMTLRAVARVVTRFLPDLAPLRPSAIWSDFGAWPLSTSWIVWTAAVVLLVVGAAFTLRRGTES